MTFKEFMDKYAGALIGVIVAILLIAFGLIYAVECFLIVAAFAWLGNYIQKNKETVKEKLKKSIDKM